MGIWGYFGLTTEADCDLPHTLSEEWFCHVQVVSAIIWYFGFGEIFRGYLNARALVGMVSGWCYSGELVVVY